MNHVVKVGIVMVGLSALAAAGIVFIPMLSAGDSAPPVAAAVTPVGVRTASLSAAPSAAAMAKADRTLAAAMAAETGAPDALSQISRVVGAPSAKSTLGLPAGMAGALAFADSSAQAGESTADLIQRARRELRDGAAPSARLLLQRAARDGAVEALTLLGASYDPAALKEMGVAGVRGDAATARKFYKQAADKGSAEAKRRLAGL